MILKIKWREVFERWVIFFMVCSFLKMRKKAVRKKIRSRSGPSQHCALKIFPPLVLILIYPQKKKKLRTTKGKNGS